MFEIIFKDLKIQHQIKNSIKHSYIRIDRDSNITLKTPKVSKSYIHSLLLEKEAWIRGQLLKNVYNPPIYLTLDGINDKKGMEYLTRKMDYFSNLMGLSYSELKFRKMKSRWGSCNSKGAITLNKKLVKTPEICIDYVVIHELAHLKHLNHSKKFHTLVDSYHPNSKEAKDILNRVVFS